MRKSLSGMTASSKSTASEYDDANDLRTNASDTGSRDGIPNDYDDDWDSEKVWVDKGGSANRKCKASVASRVQSVAGSSVAGSSNTSTTWDAIMAASGGLHAPRASAGNASDRRFASIKAVGPSAEEKAKKEAANEKRYKELEAYRLRHEGSDDEDEDGDWQL